jgi:exodeoxyribonuclease VII small subunit
VNYDKAYKELEDIMTKLQEDDIKIEKLNEYIQRAKELKEYCSKRLRDIEDEIREKE